MDILINVGYIAICVLLFALAILVHEFGHFIVAVSLGLRVEAFSIGFGPALWKKRIRGVEYRLSAIPLGGYVSIPDVDPEGTKVLEGEGDKAAKIRIPPWKEVLVAVAGPLMNVVLAVVLAVILYLVPSARFGETPAVIDVVLPGGAAAEAGILPGDRVVSVNGRTVQSWTEMSVEIQISGGKRTLLGIERATTNGVMELSLVPKRDEVTGAYFIMAVNTNGCGAAGWMPSRNPIKQLAWDAGSIFRVLKGFVTPKEARATANAVGGPVMIAESIYHSLKRSPWDGVGFLRFLNVNLAVLNLLPIPVLDGGLILFSLIALVFRRRIPDSVVKVVSMFFMYLLMALMALLIVKDVSRSWRIHTAKPAAMAQSSEGDKTSQTNETQNARD
jgi:regulator of sigma E protease